MTEELAQLGEAQLIVLGDAGAGKTALVTVLAGGPFSVDSQTTHGAWGALHRVELPSGSASSEAIALSIIDYGAQQISYEMYRLSLMNRQGLFLIVVNPRQHANVYGHIESWIRRLPSAGRETVIIALTHSDQQRNPVAQSAMSSLTKSYPQVAALITCSARTGEGMEALRDVISSIIADPVRTPAAHLLVPRSWLAVIAELRRPDGPATLTRDQFEEMCSRLNVQEDPVSAAEGRGRQSLLALLEEIGVVTILDQDVIVADQDWLNSAFFSVVESPELRSSGGEVGQTQIYRTFAGSVQASARESAALIGQLLSSGLVARVLGLEGEEDRYLIPLLLPASVDLGDPPADSLRFRYLYSRLPAALVPRYMAAVSLHLARGYPRSRLGFVVSLSGCLARVEGSVERGTVEIAVGGPSSRRRNVLSELLSAFRVVNQSFPEIDIREQVPLPSYPEIGIGYDHLLALEAQGVKVFVPEALPMLFSVEELLSGVRPESPRVVVESSSLTSRRLPIASARTWALGALFLTYLLMSVVVVTLGPAEMWLPIATAISGVLASISLLASRVGR